MREVRVFDDFMPDVESYRKFALKLLFQSFYFEKCSFHGIAPSPIDGIVPGLIQRQSPAAQPSLSFFRKSPLGQEEPHFIHTDIDMGDWSSILYLNPTPPEGDGTSFWTHKATGAIESFIPHERSEEGRTALGWDLRQHVPAKFNRLILFPSSFFHSRAIPENWGEGDEARLTQVTFGAGELFG